ncbi:MAG: type II/IV secretion system ATPase subunit [Nitrososphaerota archaeon]|nr:type II/IV secretion system ATPase subunit [Nitrososphaerota archaeon]MDG7049061.1 type II/IV secretion system ATPase subunit [Nitrososphaerota archaeon]MDG7051668.1 type II/IV secretion system ATPase subunit [Nitrososphaerota archaeon]
MVRWFGAKKEIGKTEEAKLPPAPSKDNFVSIKKLETLGDVYGGVINDVETATLRYKVIEPILTPEEVKVMELIRSLISEKLVMNRDELADTDKAMDSISSFVQREFKKRKLSLTEEQFSKIRYYIRRDYLGYGRIEPLMNDPDIEDISCDSVNTPVYIWHRIYESIPTNISFSSSSELDSFIMRMAYLAGKSISYASPMLDASLPDGNRIQLTFGQEVSDRGSNFTIRKFKADPLTIVDLITYRTISVETAAFMWYMVEKNLSILIAGGTASGKTTTLNALSAFIPPMAKVVSIEDTRELNLPHENWVASVTKTSVGLGRGVDIDLYDLLKAALRQRPDVIIVGEVRGAEAYTLLQAAATGHGGLSTIHAESVNGVIERLATKPMDVPKSFIASTLNLILLQLKFQYQGRNVRRVIRVSEIVKYDHGKDEVSFNDVFKWSAESDTMSLGKDNHIYDVIRNRSGETREEIDTNIRMRETVLRWLVKKGMRNFKEVSDAVRRFSADPKGTYAYALSELNV